MKRFWLVLLSLGLIVAFSTSAMAVDVKFSGQYYAAGMYLDKTDLAKGVGHDAVSTAFYFQRLRMTGQIIVSPGLFLTTRADIMERAWGATRSLPANALQGYKENVASAGTDAENENIAFDLCYLTYVSPIGMFTAGYQIDNAWGTVFGDNSIPTGKVGYFIRVKGFTGIAQMGKNSATNALGGIGGEQSFPRGNLGNNAASDRDASFYTLAGMYAWNTGQAGLLGKYVRMASAQGIGAVGEPLVNIFVVIPYVKAQFGPVAVQSEVMYAFGSYRPSLAYPNFDGGRIEVLNGWIDATADFGMFYAGGTFAYLSGQNFESSGPRRTQGFIDGGFDWNPCLIMWNADRTQWAGGLNGHNAAAPANNVAYGTFNTAMSNAYFFQGRGGVRPVDKLDIGLSVSYANAVIKPTENWKKSDYGWEVDLTGTYKITNNLSYMLGAGYLFTGGYFKGASDDNQVQNDFLVVNKLTLTF